MCSAAAAPLALELAEGRCAGRLSVSQLPCPPLPNFPKVGSHLCSGIFQEPSPPSLCHPRPHCLGAQVRPFRNPCAPRPALLPLPLPAPPPPPHVLTGGGKSRGSCVQRPSCGCDVCLPVLFLSLCPEGLRPYFSVSVSRRTLASVCSIFPPLSKFERMYGHICLDPLHKTLQRLSTA